MAHIVEVRHNCGETEQVTLQYGQVAVFFCVRGSGSCDTDYMNLGAGALYTSVDGDGVRRGAIAVYQATTGAEVVTMGVAPVAPGVCAYDRALIVTDVDLVAIDALDAIVAAVVGQSTGYADFTYGGENLPGNNTPGPWGPWASTSGLGGIEIAWLGRSDGQGTLGIFRSIVRGEAYIDADFQSAPGYAARLTVVQPGYGEAPNDISLSAMGFAANAPGGARRLAGSVVLWGPFTNLDASASRIRSHVSEDAGSLFQATQAVAVEAAVSEAFPGGTTLPAGVPRLFREALTPGDVALRYYPLPTRNQEMLLTVEGETALGRMARTYPAAVMTRVADIPGHAGATMTAQQAIQHVFDRWATEFEWFQPLPVPDLRLLVPEAVADPRQHYIDNPEAGVLTTEAIVIPQDGDDRRTMREIVDEWLSIFPGTIVRQNAAGSIELVPRVGPDAPDGAALTLEWRDILSMSDGEDDPRGVINRARVTSQGWEWRDDQAVVPPLYVLATRSDGLTAEAMKDVTDDLTAEPLVNGAEREFEVFVEPDTPLDVDITFSAWSASNSSGTGGLLEEVNLPVSFTVALGQTRTIEFSWFIFGTDNEKTFVYVTRTGSGLKVRVVGDRYRFGPNPFMGTRYVAYLLEVTAATGTAWTRTNTAVTAEFSLTNGDVVPGPDGSNALVTSTALYGEREAAIRSDVIQLTPEQAQAVAQGYVLHNINPRTVREVQQSEWNRYPVKFDHIGRLVDLPNGERAVIENRSYSDSFAPDGGFMQSAFTATVQELVIDTTTEYLHLDDGNYMRLDDGQLVEAS